TYTINGAYIVTLAADSGGCSVTSISKTITINTCGGGSGTCTPNAATGVPGFTPQWQCLPCVQQNINYAEVIQIENFATVGGVVIQSLRLDSLTNLPMGLSFTVNPSNGVLPGGGTACIDITGNTSVNTGNYQLGIYVTVTLNGLGSFSGELS